MELGSARAPFSAAWISLLSLEHIFTLINRSLNRFMLIVRSTSSLFPRGGTKVHSVVVYEAKLQNVRFRTHLNCHRFLRELFYAAVNNCLLISNVHPASDPSLACSPCSYQITLSHLRNHHLSLGLTFKGCCSPNLRQRHPLLTYLPQITLPAATSTHTVLAMSEKNITKKRQTPADRCVSPQGCSRLSSDTPSGLQDSTHREGLPRTPIKSLARIYSPRVAAFLNSRPRCSAGKEGRNPTPAASCRPPNALAAPRRRPAPSSR